MKTDSELWMMLPVELRMHSSVENGILKCYHPLFHEPWGFPIRMNEPNDFTTFVWDRINRFEEHKKRFDRLIDERKFQEAFFCIANPYALSALVPLSKRMTAEELRPVLAYAWCQTEFPHQNRKNQMVALFKRAGWFTDAEEDEEQTPRPENPMVLYRGVKKKTHWRGLSWTTDYKQACWFATRFGTPGFIYERKFSPHQLLAKFDGRGESEYVVNTINVQMPDAVNIVDPKRLGSLDGKE